MSVSPPPPAANIASVSQLLEMTTQLFRLTVLKCLPFGMVAVLCAEVPNFYWIASGHTLEHGFPTDSRYWALSLLAGAVSLYIFSAMMLRQRAFAAGAAVNVGAELAEAARRLPVLLPSWLLMQLSLFVGFMLLIVPGVFLLVCYLVLLPVVLFEPHNPISALVRCVALVRPHWWKVLATLVIALLAVLVCMLVVAALLNILAAMLAGQGPAFEAIVAAGTIAIGAVVVVFMSALALTLHSTASNSA